MASAQRILLGVVIDIVCLILTFVPWLILKYGPIEPFKRGFFCDDESLQHPYKESTVPNAYLIVLAVGVCISMLVLEAIHFGIEIKEGKVPPRYQIGKFGVPMYLVRVYQLIGVFLFGVAVQQTITNILKYSIGRLRPHFFAVCNATVIDCKDENGFYKYVTEYECQGTDAHRVQESRLSFLSGHASSSMFSMCYLGFYLQSRMTWKFSRLLRPFLQVGFFWLALGICVSRISDYKHHWSDVLAGAIQGITVAFLTSLYVGKIFRSRIQVLDDRVAAMLQVVGHDHPTSTAQNDVESPLEESAVHNTVKL